MDLFDILFGGHEWKFLQPFLPRRLIDRTKSVWCEELRQRRAPDGSVHNRCATERDIDDEWGFAKP